MRKALLGCLMIMAVALAPTTAFAQRSEVGLGVSLGAVFPKGGDVSFSDTGFNWGFWVDIPVAWKFHITPSAELYNLGGSVGEHPFTDIEMNFKFILPVSFTKIFFGAAGGVTVSTKYDANAGILGGVSFNLISSLDVFVMAKYKVIIKDPNIHMLHTNAGLLFWF